jgi:hypothetical protein
MKIKSIYISGPITGVADAEKKFKIAEMQLKAAGFEVCNPFELGNRAIKMFGFKTWAEVMKYDLSLMLERDAVYMLKHWEMSAGAVVEHDLAKVLGMPVLYEVEKNYYEALGHTPEPLSSEAV